MENPVARLLEVAAQQHGLFTVEQAAYADYLFKAARKQDDRLLGRRLSMSNSLTAAARSFWETITRDVHDWREPIA